MQEERNTPEKKRNVTVIDVARESGVSSATVSRVLSGYEFVKESTRLRVMEAVERLGYVVNFQARSLASGRSQLIGLVVPHLDNGYVGTIMKGVDYELENTSYDLILYTSRGQPEKESSYVRAIAGGLTEGMLLVAPLIPAEYLQTLREQKFPCVLIDQADDTQSSSLVDASNWQGAYDATRYLIASGHTQIAFIKGAMLVRSAFDRLNGYKAAMKDAGLLINENWILEGDYQQQTGYESTKALLMCAESRPTAILASNDLSAFGAMDAARECGLNIPDDISVIGFDDVPQAALVYPRLTTVHQPLEEMGKIAARLLLAQIEDRSLPPQRVTLDTRLVIRESCKVYESCSSDKQSALKKTGGSL